LAKDFKADEKFMDILFQVLVDRHANFLPPEEKMKNSKVKNKKSDKTPKAHVVTKSKKEKMKSWIYMCVFIQKILIILSCSVFGKNII